MSTTTMSVTPEINFMGFKLEALKLDYLREISTFCTEHIFILDHGLLCCYTCSNLDVYQHFRGYKIEVPAGRCSKFL